MDLKTAPYDIQCGFAGKGGIGFDHPKIDQFIEGLEQYALQNEIIFKKNCAYVQEYEGEAQWYKCWPTKSIDTSYDGNLISCNAANNLPNIHFACGYDASPVVSNKFKNVVEENDLTGLEFLWCKDVGRFAPSQQWYKAIATEFMGRGVDAPWINVTSPSLHDSDKYPKNLGRMAVTRFPASCLAKDAVLPERLIQYMSLCDVNSFNINFYERFLKSYLPQTDFAFGYFPGWEGFYISKRAKDILTSNRLFNDHDKLEPVADLDQLPNGSLQLDGLEPVPDFSYGARYYIKDITFAELKVLHQQAKEAYDKAPKPRKIVTMKQALSLVNSEKKRRPLDFNKRLTDKELAGISMKLPANWIDLLKKTNGGFLSLECEVISLKHIETFTAEKLKQGKDFYDEYPEKYDIGKRKNEQTFCSILDNDGMIERYN